MDVQVTVYYTIVILVVSARDGMYNSITKCKSQVTSENCMNK